MNYNDVQFYIASESRTKSIEIGKLLGRKDKTFLTTTDIAEFYAYIKKCTEFTCFVLQITNQYSNIESMIKTILQKNPNFPVILLSSNPISLEKYRNFLHMGVTDVLVYDSETVSEKIIEDLSRSLRLKWNAYQYAIEESEKIFKATVVTTNHEINQPLTVILNAIGLLGTELKSITNRDPKVKSHFEFISKSTQGIQLILEKLKRIKSVKLKEYTPGVPMIDLEKDNPSLPNLNKVKINNKDTILFVGQNLTERVLIESEIKKMGLEVITTDNLEDAKSFINRMMNKIQAIMLSDNLPTNDLESTLIELNSRKDFVPVILVKSNQPSIENIKLLDSNTFQILNRPITAQNLQTALSKTVLMIH